MSSSNTSNSKKTMSTSVIESDSASMMSYSSTASTIALIKNKFTTSSRRDKKEDMSPREKQVEKSKGRMSSVTLATVMALR
ncbi:hypothetical protein Slin15195_G066270 [Septoria linicola]|uniref:Uncharacterized protein n=1 Tax=Septoria linicola TaxID=215465 RepID=A0A9Q9AWC9_9PEZI|nr:hypothetical protein Slin15195_G066270 [Septoria linicola]